MKLSNHVRFLFTAALGFAVFALTAPAQLIGNLKEQATFSPFTGGSNNSVTNNGSFNTAEVIHTGTPTATPFTITYTPLSGPFASFVSTDTLVTSTFTFHSPVTPLGYFSNLKATLNYDFDNDSVVDLSQVYNIKLTAFTAPNGLTGVHYAITPVNDNGTVIINSVGYAFASTIANSVGTLFDGSSTTSEVQFQFLPPANLFQPVPEPSTYALAGVAALGGIVWLRRQQRRFASFGPIA